MSNKGEAPGAHAPGRKTRITCGYCHRPIHMQRNGAWYHSHNASVACYPGSGSGKKAFRGGTR